MVEPLETRNQSEIAPRRFGGEVTVEDRTIAITGMPRLAARNLHIPSDLSSAAFFLGAALLLPGSRLRIHGVGLNPTHTAVLSVPRSMGALIGAHPESMARARRQGPSLSAEGILSGVVQPAAPGTEEGVGPAGP